MVCADQSAISSARNSSSSGRRHAGRDGLADVGMIQHDEVVARAEIRDGVRLESFERLPCPSRWRCRHARGSSARGGGGQGVEHRADGPRSGRGSGSRHIPVLADCSRRDERIDLGPRDSRPPAARRACARRRAARRGRPSQGVFENLIGNPGVFTCPSVGWSYSTKVPLCATCASSTRSAYE